MARAPSTRIRRTSSHSLSFPFNTPLATMIPRSTLPRHLSRSIISPISTRRILSTTSAAQNARAPPTTGSADSPARPHTIDPRWLTMMKRRIGRCMMFGLNPARVHEAGSILQQLARDWRGLIAGSEGFLTDEKRCSLFRHNVVWGEMV